uniref:Chromosome 11 open reading frame 97 n=1 Tax=Chelonoidis abingdonii TaxID=106734 RepID=A0A8C0JD96_CHEAB
MALPPPALGCPALGSQLPSPPALGCPVRLPSIPCRGTALPWGPSSHPPPWKKFVYVEPPKRVKEVLEEELYFWRDGCQIKHPAAVALEGIWSVKRNFSVGGLTPASQNRNSLLSQPKYYSRHGGIRSKTVISRFQL